MDEFKVILVMNETMIELLKDKNESCEKNLKIKQYLEDEAFFFKIDKSQAYTILQNVGVKQEQLEKVYKKLIEPKVFYDLLYKGKLNEDDKNLIVKYKTYRTRGFIQEIKNGGTYKMSDEYIRKFYNEVNNSLEGDYKIILEPNRKFTEDWIEYDTVKWELEEPIKDLVNGLLKNNEISFEEKILEIYKYICLNYIYDDNVLYFFKRDTSDPDNIKYIAVDWYGRIIDETWQKNRNKHNRRVCYEFARFYAKAINELLDGNDNLEAFMLGDKENLHYVVGLTGKDYSVILDVDDFNKIKDLTRLKLGLTINGITILRDDSGKFKKIIEKYNENKPSDLQEIKETERYLKEKDMIEYFNKIIEKLRVYNIDSQGFMEYMRAKIENEGIEIEKIWKEIKGGPEKRYVRCLFFNFNQKTYLLDSVEQKLITVEKENLNNKEFIINPEDNQYPYYGG